jgi:hypothetical protein
MKTSILRFGPGAAILGLVLASISFAAPETPAPAAHGTTAAPAGLEFYHGSAEANAFQMPEQVPVLEIRRPYLVIGNAVIIRVTDQEWAKLVEAYPNDALQNADGKQALIFSAPVKAKPKAGP